MMKKNSNCQNCGKPTEGGKFCSPECGQVYYRKPEGPKPLAMNRIEIRKEAENNRAPQGALDHLLETQLTNTQWQKGLAWRQEKIEAIAEARRRGINEKIIFKHLKRSGLTDPTARKIMNDAQYCE